ncbi:MAG: Mur ligase family protein [Bacillota bacterium]
MKSDKLLKTISIIDTRPETANLSVEPSNFTGIAYHSGKVSDGFLFVCIRGYKTDGHLYIDQAAQKGALAAIVEDFQNTPITQYKVADSRQALAALADRYYNYPSKKINLTGVTATNGKTTTTYMINSILEEHGLNTGLIGTVIVKAGNKIEPADLTTPESLDLHRFFSHMVEENVTHAVMEVSSSGLELKRVGNVNFNTVVVNNISREHIDLHGSFEDYYNAKASLVRTANKNQWAVFNLDCPQTAPLVKETAANPFTYGIKNRKADIVVDNLDLSTGRARFEVNLKNKRSFSFLSKQPESFSINLSVLGLHSVYNSMAAILVSLINNIPADTISKALHNFRGVERRFELIFEDDFKVLDDHFANSGNINVTLETLQMMDCKKLHLVYAIRGSRGITVNKENAETLAYWAPKLGLEKIIATTSSSHVGEKDLVTTEELEVYKKVIEQSGLKTEIYEELPDAIAAGLKETEKGDVLLLAGCQGMDYGASICLGQIQKKRPDLPESIVFAALKNRVAGV